LDDINNWGGNSMSPELKSPIAACLCATVIFKNTAAVGVTRAAQ
jgi:hypothetical protein